MVRIPNLKSIWKKPIVRLWTIFGCSSSSNALGQTSHTHHRPKQMLATTHEQQTHEQVMHSRLFECMFMDGVDPRFVLAIQRQQVEGTTLRTLRTLLWFYRIDWYSFRHKCHKIELPTQIPSATYTRLRSLGRLLWLKLRNWQLSQVFTNIRTHLRMRAIYLVA